MTAGISPSRRLERAPPLPARSRFFAMTLDVVAISLSPFALSSSRRGLQGCPSPDLGNSILLIEQARNRGLLGNALHRLPHQGGDPNRPHVWRPPHPFLPLDPIR